MSTGESREFQIYTQQDFDNAFEENLPYILTWRYDKKMSLALLPMIITWSWRVTSVH